MEDKKEKGEDVTKYGEFVSSYFGWKTPNEQKKTVNKLENITNQQNKEKNKEKER